MNINDLYKERKELTNRLNEVEVNINDLYKERKELTNRLNEVEEAIKAARKQLASKYEIVRRTASTLIINKDTGVGVVVSKPNSYTERKIHYWNGKKGELITDAFRGSDYAVRDWIASKQI